MIVTGNVQVARDHLSLGRDVVIPEDADDGLEAFETWAACIHSGGGRRQRPLAIMQLSHAGRQSPNGLGGRLPFVAPVAPSAVAVGSGVRGVAARVLHRVVFQTPRAMEGEEVDGVVAAFVRGARVAARAGFDGVQLHAAHGCECVCLFFCPKMHGHSMYALDLLAQFMSPKVRLFVRSLGRDFDGGCRRTDGRTSTRRRATMRCGSSAESCSPSGRAWRRSLCWGSS